MPSGCLLQLGFYKGLFLTEIGKETSLEYNVWSRQISPSCFPNLPAGVSRSLISPLCDAMVPHSLLFPALLGLCPSCLGSHHSPWYVLSLTHILYTHTVMLCDTARFCMDPIPSEYKANIDTF